MKKLFAVFMLSVSMVAFAESEVRTFTALSHDNGSPTQACSMAKQDAEFWARNGHYKIKNFTRCDCSNEWDGRVNKYRCNVDATFSK